MGPMGERLRSGNPIHPTESRPSNPSIGGAIRLRTRNSVRSPMAAALFNQIFGRAIYVGSAGVRKGELDPFAVAIMEEIGPRYFARR